LCEDVPVLELVALIIGRDDLLEILDCVVEGCEVLWNRAAREDIDAAENIPAGRVLLPIDSKAAMPNFTLNK